MFCDLHSQERKETNDYILSRAAFYDGEYTRADDLIKKYITKNKRDIQAFYLQALIYERMDKNLKAINALTDLLMLDPGHLEGGFKRGELYYHEGLYIQAINDFTSVLEYSEERNTQGVFFRIDPEGQEQVKVVTIRSMKSQIHGFRALCYQDIGEYDKSLSDFDSAIEIDSTASNYVNRSLLFKELGDVPSASRDLKIAISLDDEYSLAWFNLLLIEPETTIPTTLLEDVSFVPLIVYQAIEALQDGDLATAERLMAHALQVRPNDDLILLNAGRLEHRMGRYEKARIHYKHALDVSPTSYEAYYLIANTFYHEKEYQASAAYYEQYLVRDRSNGQVWYNAALAYKSLKDEDTACRYLINARERGLSFDVDASLFAACDP
jgi:tetratricopeptide (TPR) repeat protein